MKKGAILTGVFLLGFCVYPLMEIAARGYTHLSMAFAGGICACLIWGIAGWRVGLPIRVFASATAITAVELCFGVVFNLWLRLDVWDYGNMTGNLMGQICPAYFFVWLLLSLPVCVLFRFLRRRILHA